jgi:hypothetical protein
MESRMKRYEEDSTKKISRSARNQDLYEKLNDNNTYTTYTNVTNANAIVLDAASKNYRTREGYQKIKEYSDLIPQPKMKQKLEDLNNLYQDNENKVYDINSVIEEAKRNRVEKDELEEKRRLKNENYNILNSIDEKKLEEFRANRNKAIRADQEEIKGLINTITTKAINGELDRETSVNLLSDLMATQALDRVEGMAEEEQPIEVKKEDDNKDILSESDMKLVEEKKEEFEATNQNTNHNKVIFKDMDQSFYTRSMDLSDKDFDLKDEEDEDGKKKGHTGLKVFFVLFLLAIVGVLVYFVIKKVS